MLPPDVHGINPLLWLPCPEVDVIAYIQPLVVLTKTMLALGDRVDCWDIEGDSGE